MPYMIYEDSLTRMYGSPGSGKSFVALDMALSLAAGRAWGGRMVKPTRVVYVMAEGQAVNADRMDAWLSRNGVDIDRIEDTFFVVPDAVMLTEHAAAPFVDWVRENQPKLVVLDTKNAMMAGEENSASDFAAMRRTLDAIRKASGCCVMLVDHTGYEGTRARGSSAGTAAMDTEIRVDMDDTDRPVLITAEVTRDKAAESGHRMAWRLTPEHPAAVLVPVDVPEQRTPVEIPIWTCSPLPIPEEILDYKGTGATHLETLSRLMMHDAGRAAEPSRIGLSRAEVCTLVKEAAAVVPHVSFNKSGVIRAWSVLQELAWIEAATEKTNEVGRHIWVDKTRRFQDPSEDQL